MKVRERPGRDEQDVLRVDDDEVVLVPVLRDVERREDLAALEQLQHALLNALAADVARSGAGTRALAAPRDLVDLVDEHDSALGELDVLVRVIQQLADHHLDVLAVVAGLGVLGRVGDDERDVEAVGQRARDVRLTRAGRAQQQHVRLLDQALSGGGRLAAPFEVVVSGDGDRALGALLADHVTIEIVVDLTRRQRLSPFADARVRFHAAASIPPVYGPRHRATPKIAGYAGGYAGTTGTLFRGLRGGPEVRLGHRHGDRRAHQVVRARVRSAAVSHRRGGGAPH